MRTFSTLYERPVFNRKTGNQIGDVIDLLFNKQGTVVGLLVDKKGWLNRDLVIPWDVITSMGIDGVMVKEVDSIGPFKKNVHDFFSLRTGTQRINGKPLMTSEGEKLGLVEDVYFSEKLGNIVGYEVTEGLIADLKEGRKVVRSKEPLTIGEDILIINLEV